MASIGDRVVISGTGEKNGKIGVVISDANSAGRYEVRLEGSGDIVSLPIGNLWEISDHSADPKIDQPVLTKPQKKKPIVSSIQPLSQFQLQFSDIPAVCIPRIIGKEGSVINVMTKKFKTYFQQNDSKVSPHSDGHQVYLFIFIYRKLSFLRIAVHNNIL